MRLLDRLTQEAGRDAREEANRRHPKLLDYTLEEGEKIAQAVQTVMDSYGYPHSAEYAERVYIALEANGELDRIAGRSATQSSPEFKPKSADVEADFFSDPNTTAEDIKQYLQAKHGAR